MNLDGSCSCPAICGCAAMCDSAAVRAVVCGSAHGSMRAVCATLAVCTTVCDSARHVRITITQTRAQYILVCPCRGSGNEPHIPHILIQKIINTRY
jgi:hypothetical protein